MGSLDLFKTRRHWAYFFFLIFVSISLTNCKTPENKDAGLGSTKVDKVPGSPDRHWVPGCEAPGRADEMNPHCLPQEGEEALVLLAHDVQFAQLHSIVVDEDYIYVGGSDSSYVCSIWRIPILGGQPEKLFTRWWSNSQNACWAFSMEIVDEILYVVDPNSGPSTDTEILVGPKDGSQPLHPIYRGSQQSYSSGLFPVVDGSGITFDGARLIVSDHVQGRLSAMSLEGSNLQNISGARYGGYFDVEHRSTLAFFNGQILVAESAETGNCNCGVFIPSVLSLNPADGLYQKIYSGSPLVHPKDISIAIDTGDIFLVDPDAGNAIFKIVPSTGSIEVVHAGFPFRQLMGIEVRSGYAYLIDSGMGSEGRVYRFKIER